MHHDIQTNPHTGGMDPPPFSSQEGEEKGMRRLIPMLEGKQGQGAPPPDFAGMAQVK